MQRKSGSGKSDDRSRAIRIARRLMVLVLFDMAYLRIFDGLEKKLRGAAFRKRV